MMTHIDKRWVLVLKGHKIPKYLMKLTSRESREIQVSKLPLKNDVNNSMISRQWRVSHLEFINKFCGALTWSRKRLEKDGEERSEKRPYIGPKTRSWKVNLFTSVVVPISNYCHPWERVEVHPTSHVSIRPSTSTASSSGWFCSSERVLKGLFCWKNCWDGWAGSFTKRHVNKLVQPIMYYVLCNK